MEFSKLLSYVDVKVKLSMTSILFLFDVFFLTALDVVTLYIESLDVTYNHRIGE